MTGGIRGIVISAIAGMSVKICDIAIEQSA
jgi:hypothetical protein